MKQNTSSSRVRHSNIEKKNTYDVVTNRINKIVNAVSKSVTNGSTHFSLSESILSLCYELPIHVLCKMLTILQFVPVPFMSHRAKMVIPCETIREKEKNKIDKNRSSLFFSHFVALLARPRFNFLITDIVGTMAPQVYPKSSICHGIFHSIEIHALHSPGNSYQFVPDGL